MMRLNPRNVIDKLFTFLFLLFFTNSFATTYYVSNTGDDSHAGTSIADAWASIGKVNATVFLPGDKLYFQGGQTFNGSIDLDGGDANDPGNVFVISSYGTGRAIINAGNSYGFRAHNTQGFSVSDLIFDGNDMSTNTDAGMILFADSSGDIKFSNISISRIEVRNFGAQGMMIGGWNNLTGYQDLILSNLSVHDVKANGIQVYGYTDQALVGWPNKNVSISDCEVYNVPGFPDPSGHQGSGIVVSGVDGAVIQHCVAHDNGQDNSHCGGPGGIWCWDSNQVTIQFCESYRNHSGAGCDGLGFDLDGGVTNSILQYNYSHDNDGAGYLLGQFENARPWNNNTVRYNISENDGILNEGSIGLFKGPNSTMSDINIYNNTVYVSPQAGNSDECAVYFKNWTTGIDRVAFYNNIFFSTGGSPFINIPVGYSAFFAGNIYWASGGSFSIHYQGKDYSSLADWRTGTGNEIVSGSNAGYESDPMLTDAGSGGIVGFGNSLMSLKAYKIKSPSSPAYHSALDLNAQYAIDPGSMDFWGTGLPGGNANDVGANQYNSILPIKLLSFYGNCSGSENNLFWTTAEEINMKSIDLMYSNDGLYYSRIADINPKGSNSRYSYVNEVSLPGNHFYQLKMVDLDAAITYSPVVQLKCGGVSNKTRVWPNPFNQSIHVSLVSAASGSATMALLDEMGKLLSKRKVQLQEGNNQLIYDGVEGLPAGIYYLRIVNRDKVEHFELLKAG